MNLHVFKCFDRPIYLLWATYKLRNADWANYKPPLAPNAAQLLSLHLRGLTVTWRLTNTPHPPSVP